MTQILTTASRRSRFLFDASAVDSLASKDQLLNALSGQVATFSRASTKLALDENGIYRIVPKGLPAYDYSLDPVSGLMVPSLLFEGEARTNGVVQTGFASGWTPTRASLTTAPVLSSRGSVTSVFLQEPNTAATSRNLYADADITITNAIPYCYSVVAKARGCSWITLQGDGANGYLQPSFQYFNLATGTPGALASGSSARGMVALGNGWYRCWVTGTSSGTTARPVIWLAAADGNYSVTGDGASGVCFDLPQLEAGTFPSSPIITTTVAVTRQPDALSWALPISAQLMTTYLNARLWQGADSSADRLLWTISPGSAPTLSGGTFASGTSFAATHYTDGSTSVWQDTAVALTYGQQVELRTVIENSGGFAKLTTGVSVEGGAETVVVTTTAAAFPASYPGAVLTLGGFMSLRALRIG